MILCRFSTCSISSSIFFHARPISRWGGKKSHL